MYLPYEITLLDHGYVKLIEAWGTGIDGREWTDKPADYEIGIIEAARQSTQGSFRGWDKDAKLLKYLHDHHHATPFEFSGMVIEVQAPIFVFREWHRHRTQSYNEMSARYAPLPALDYTPTVARVAYNATGQSNRQATGMSDRIPSALESQEWLHRLTLLRGELDELYREGLNIGIPKEISRLAMTVGRYSKMRASANLRNWLSFLTLRMDPAAQWEIRQYADCVGCFIRSTFPRTWELFELSRARSTCQENTINPMPDPGGN